MAGPRVAALLIAAALAACIDPVAERTRRDFEECGRADLGALEAAIDQGIVLPWIDAAPQGLAVRLRANAPAVSLTARSKSNEPQRLTVRLDNLPDDALLPADATDAVRSPQSATFTVSVPAGGEWTATIAPPAPTGPFRFAWVGDVHSGLARFERVRAAIDADPSIAFVLFAGDITSKNSKQEFAEFVVAADRLERPWYALLGNHDASVLDDEEFQRTVGRLNFGFDFRGARFLMLDSASATVAERVWDYARASLAGDEPPVRIVGMHVPPLDYQGLRDSGFASRAEGARMMGLLTNAGVDLLLAGHLHTLRFTQTAGVEIAVSGNGGVGTEDKLDGVGLHYLSVDVDPLAQTVGANAIEVP